MIEYKGFTELWKDLIGKHKTRAIIFLIVAIFLFLGPYVLSIINTQKTTALNSSAVTFNGNVTINGNVETYNNGSVKIIDDQAPKTVLSVFQLKNFIETKLPHSISKEKYKEAADILSNPPKDKNLIIEAILSIRNFSIEAKQNIVINDTSDPVKEAFQELLKQTQN